MSFFETNIINIIILFFPLMVYLFYVMYSQNVLIKEKQLFLDFALFSSVYLLIRYNVSNYYDEYLILLNIPLIIAYLRKHITTAIIISILIIIECHGYLPIIINYFILFVFYLFFYKNKKDNIFFVNGAIIINIIYLTFNYNNWYDIESVLKTILLITIFTIIAYFADYIFSKCEEIIKLNNSIKMIEKDKQFRTSLFRITHEIKNPVAVCKSYLDMFDMNNKEHEKYIYIVKEEINKILLLLQDFLSMNKIKIEAELLDINLLLEDTKFQLEDFAKKNNACFNCKFVKDEIFIEGDYNRLSQVFINLIKNSIEANANIIDIKTKINDKKIIIMIKDNGDGISKDNLEKIREPFYTTKKNGTGLGVSLSCEIIEAHKGTISYSSKEGIGTEIKIILPIFNYN